MSHITVSPPSSLPSQASGPNSGAHNSLLSQCEWKRSIIPSQPNVFKDSNECNAVTQKMDFREGEGEKKKAILRLWRSIITLLPSPHPLPFQIGVCAHGCVCMCVCAPAIKCVSTDRCA